MLVWANLRGTNSHGIIRIPRYIDLIKAKSINAAPNIRVERKEGAAVVLEADRAPSAVAMTRAMTEAMDCARKVHVGMCAARNVTHTGAIGYFARAGGGGGLHRHRHERVRPDDGLSGHARAGGVVQSDRVRGAAPERPAVSARTSPPASSPTARSWARPTAARKSRSAGASTRTASDTTDPKAVETLLPLGGAKGAGLSFMIECLTSLLLSHPRIAPDLESWAIGDDPFLNGTVIAIDIGGFGDPDRFAAEAERLGTAIAGLARADGVDKIMLPGERGDAIRAEREASGIPIPKGTWQRIAKAAQAAGVTPPM